jgi:hypothetical protein
MLALAFHTLWMSFSQGDIARKNSAASGDGNIPRGGWKDIALHFHVLWKTYPQPLAQARTAL